MRAAALNRKLHRWGAIITALPVLVIFGTGFILQLKKDWAWVQPPTARGEAAAGPTIPFERILMAANSVPEAEVGSWADIDRLDVRPDRGVVKVRCKNRWEVQVDTATGAVLATNYRRSDLIESIHDGSFFGVKLLIFLPCSLVLLGLWVTGVYLWLLPHLVKWDRAKKRRAASASVA